jgi:hypothetical protein
MSRAIRLRRVWAILVTMTAVAVTVGATTAFSESEKPADSFLALAC